MTLLQTQEKVAPFFVPEGRRILAGEESTGILAPKFFQPLKGERPEFQSGALPGRRFPSGLIPVVSPPANLRSASGAEECFLECYSCRFPEMNPGLSEIIRVSLGTWMRHSNLPTQE